MVRLHTKFVLHILGLVTIVNCQFKFATDCNTPNHVQGLCVDIKGCKKLYDQILLDNKETFAFIRESRCDPDNEGTLPKVCCGPDINFTNATEENIDVADASEGIPSMGQPIPLSTTSAPISGHSVLPRICGKQKIMVENKIFGGREAGIGEFPWLARLVHYNRYNRTGVGCSGFVIHRRFVLTAAHCLVGKGVEYLGPLNHVILGVHNDTKVRVCVEQICTDPPLTVEVLPQIVHPKYNSTTHIHDIALVPLKEKLNFTDYIKAICVP
ncbi:Trypsin, partial [Oryctes borbonicus]